LSVVVNCNGSPFLEEKTEGRKGNERQRQDRQDRQASRERERDETCV